MSVRIGFAPGPFTAETAGSDLLCQLVKMADTVGYDSVWLSDRVVSDRFSLEPLISLAMVAAYSKTLKFGTSVIALPLRHPVLLAKEMATLDYLSGGRFLPAVGLGQEDPQEYEACGVDKETRGERTDEALGLIRRLWCEERVTHEGRFFTLHDVTITPKPAQKPCPPIWIGGRTRAAQRRVGRVGDGWLVSQATPGEIDLGKEVIFATAAEHGRHVDEDHIGVMLGFCIAPTKEGAARIAEPYLLRQRPDAHYTEYSALGPAKDVVDAIERYLAAGATKFVVRPLCPPDQGIAQLELFGREILPRFQR